MMKYLDVKSCATCVKKQMCKYAENRENLEKHIKDKIVPYALVDAPFTFLLTCNEYLHDVKERSFA